MPIMDGYDTMRAMRRLTPTATSRSSPSPAPVEAGERQRCIDAGATAYVTKPVDTAELLVVLGEWLPRTARGRAARRGRLMSAAALIEAPAVSPAPPAAVLVVDDNAGKRLAVGRCWRPWATPWSRPTRGAPRWRPQRQNFAVILMDVVMPILDGYETARLIRQRTQSQDTPIIFLTAFRRDETETAAAYANGAVDFIFTPVLAEVLRAKVSAFVHLFLQSQELQRSLESITALNIEMLARLAAAAEFRDDDTGQHTRRVGDLSVAIAAAPRRVRSRDRADPARGAPARRRQDRPPRRDPGQAGTAHPRPSSST